MATTSMAGAPRSNSRATLLLIGGLAYGRAITPSLSVLLASIALFLAFIPDGAAAHRPLKKGERSDIVDSANLTGPNGKRVADSTCVAGRLSTLNRHWAAIHLTNTRSCVQRYGGASGESVLLKRSSLNSRQWRRVGTIGDNCQSREGGASNRVLRDLGCGVFYGFYG